jgi:hypothetical protein
VENILRKFYNLEEIISNLDNQVLKKELEKDSLILYKRSDSEKTIFNIFKDNRNKSRK